MERIKLIDSEAFETKNVFNFEEGEVTIVEREVHEFYAFDRPAGTRLIIDNAIQSTRNFIAKSRSEMAELNSLLRELTVK
jgi:hypothetical protein